MTRNWPIFILWLTLISPLAFSNGEEANWIVENAPAEYIVKEGDTLWDIACRFLHDPWRWPQVWHANPELQNPHLIYPGDRITLSYVEGRPRLAAVRRFREQTVDEVTGIVKLHPRVRVLPADRAIPAIPLHVIKPFFNESRVVTQEQAYYCPEVVALDEDHLVIGKGDRFYVSGLSLTDYETVYSVFRPVKTYRDPHSLMPLGIEGHVLGDALVELAGEPSRFLVTRSLAEIRVGDRIINTYPEEFDPFFIPKLPRGEARGQIISVFGGLTQISQFQVIVVTGGKDCERSVGDVLAIYQTQKDLPSRLRRDGQFYHFPPYKIGRCIVFRVFDKVSYALVMNATRPIYLLDDVWSP